MFALRDWQELLICFVLPSSVSRECGWRSFATLSSSSRGVVRLSTLLRNIEDDPTELPRTRGFFKTMDLSWPSVTFRLPVGCCVGVFTFWIGFRGRGSDVGLRPIVNKAPLTYGFTITSSSVHCFLSAATAEEVSIKQNCKFSGFEPG